jgi:hypothetical protein
MKMDLIYIDSWSLWLDTKILFKTVPAMILGRGEKYSDLSIEPISLAEASDYLG